MRSLFLLALLGLAYGAPSQRSGLCEVCHLLVGEVQDLVTTGQTQKSVTDYVENICSSLSSEEKDVCQSFINDNSQDIFSQLSKDLSPHEFCMTLDDVCAPQEEPEVYEPEPVVNPSANPLECELCKLAVLGIDKLIGQNKSEAAINATLEKFCMGLPEKISGLCLQVEPMVLDAIKSGLEPGVACKVVRLCSALNVEDPSQITCGVCHAVMGAIGIQDTGALCEPRRTCLEEEVIEPVMIEEPEEEIVEPVEIQASAVGNAIECQICKFAIQAVDHVLEENRTAAAINATLMQLCNGLPGELKDSCLNVAPDILKAILGGIDPSKACDFLKICNDAKKGFTQISCDACLEAMETVAGEKGVSFCYKFEDICRAKETLTVNADAKCELCEFVVQLLDEVLASGGTIEKLNETLIEICTFVPDNLKAACNALVPQIDKIIAAGVDPKTACEAIKFCSATEELNVLTDEIKCELCSKLGETMLASKIKSGICKEVCHQRERRSTLTKLGKMIKSAKVESPLMRLIKEKENQNVGDLKCELCEAVIQMLDTYIEDNATDAKINATLIQLCNSLPDGQFRDLCLQEEAVIMGAIEQGFDPQATCQRANLCAADLSLSGVSSDDAFLQYLNQRMTNKVGDIKCDICEGAVKLVDKYIENNATIEQINQTLYQICSSLPDGAFKDICNEQVPAIMKIVENGGFDPEKVCTAAGLCNANLRSMKTKTVKKSMFVRKVMPVVEEDTPMPNTDGNLRDLKCTVCEAVIKEIDSLVQQNETIDKINATIYNVCENLIGALKDLCLQSAPQILQAIEAGVDPQETCTKIGLCASKVAEITVDIEPVEVGDIKCDICELIVEGIDRLIQNNATDEKINATVYNLCNQLPGTAAKYCIMVAPTVVKAIEGGADPAKVCELVKLCDATQKVKMDTVDNYGDIKCDICELLIDEIDKYIGNASAAQINATVYEVCGRLPSALQSYCIQLAPTIVKELENGVDPKEACTKLKLCTSAVVQYDEPAEIEEPQVDIKCDVCEFLISEMDKILVDNATDKMINASIFAVCSKLTGTAQLLCLTLAPGLVRDIERGLDPNKACVILTLCPAAEQPITPQVDIKCDVCEFLISEMDKILVDNATDAKINASIFAVCGKLSGTAQLLCLTLAPGLVNDIERGLDPNKACTVLTLCPSKVIEIEPEPIAPQVDVKCDVCEFLISEMDKILVDNATDKMINASIYSVCGKLSGAANLICKNLAPGLVQNIEAGLDPNAACVLLTLCPAKGIEEKTELEAPKVDVKCDVCEFLISEMDKILVDNATDAKINASIYSVCGKLSGTANLICRNLAPGLVRSIESGLDPNSACVLLTFCPSTETEASTEEIAVDTPEITGTYVVQSLECDICRRSLQAAYDEVDEMKLKNMLLTICDRMPVSHKNQCETLVSNYGDTYVKKVLKQYTPTHMCELAQCFENEEPSFNGSS